jgi:hypothetical protein
MKKYFIILTLTISFFIPDTVFSRIRCGNDLISIGDRAFRVQRTLKQCGEVLDKEVIETTSQGSLYYDPETDENRATYQEDTIKKERWWIRVDEGSGYYCYPLIFEAGTLKKVERWESCD